MVRDDNVTTGVIMVMKELGTMNDGNDDDFDGFGDSQPVVDGEQLQATTHLPSPA